MPLTHYLKRLDQHYRTGKATEHSYRADLQTLIKTLLPSVDVTNEPSEVTDCGNPDYVVSRDALHVGFIEAKDLDKDLDARADREQFARYRKGLDNLIITNYLCFRFYVGGELQHAIRVGEIRGGCVTPLRQHFAEFTNLLNNFCHYHRGPAIESPSQLAAIMAAKARLLQTTLARALIADAQVERDSALSQQFESFKKVLLHDLTSSDFADLYAQTLVYGLFAARLHARAADTFSRQQAAELIPPSNPFLRKLFLYVAGPEIDARIKTTLENLVEVLRVTELEEILKNFGKNTATEDPIIHFYETFLSEYDAKLRQSRGVYYTPKPVVNFIVRAVDHILQTEFGLADGLADTAQTEIKVKTDTGTTEKTVHRIQILDPATGTGTFLTEIVRHIYAKLKAQRGSWRDYVEQHLLPRLNGFELLMAPYAIAHLNVDLALKAANYQPKHAQRFNIYLTNALEQYQDDQADLPFVNWLSDEANQANRIKRETPIMVVLGNPPYSGESANKGEWIMKLMQDYKQEPGGAQKLQERNPKWINDDYVKFLRYGQHFIEKNGSGVLAYINPHGFLDNPTFRGMRWHLLKTYDKIYTLDLHGNARRKETAPDGSPDVNVFDIQQGVSINLFIKTGEKNADQLGQVLHYDLYGERQAKYDFLWQNDLTSVPFQPLPNTAPMYFMLPKDLTVQVDYNKGFSICDLFVENVTGIVTARDSVVVNISAQALLDKIEKFCDQGYSDSEIRTWLFPGKKPGKYLAGDSIGWKLSNARREIAKNIHKDFIKDVAYRPFDVRKIYYSPAMLEGGREKYMQHFRHSDNVGLVSIRRSRSSEGWREIVVVDKMVMGATTVSALDINYAFPLYCYPETGSQQSLDHRISRKPNLNQDIVDQIAATLGLTFTAEKKTTATTFAPIDLLDYSYAVLHRPTYRQTYQEFLKLDFPRVPYPQDAETFWPLVKLGRELRQLHLLQSPTLDKPITRYPNSGDNIVTRKMTATSRGFEATSNGNGRVWINANQYFDQVPKTAWQFYIGGYQPAQKWLKDRCDRQLDYADIQHYQKMIKALVETARLMGVVSG